jgi:hypothetical protein
VPLLLKLKKFEVFESPPLKKPSPTQLIAGFHPTPSSEHQLIFYVDSCLPQELGNCVGLQSRGVKEDAH